MEIVIPQRIRRILVWVGYPLFALLVASIALFASIPRERVKDKIETTLSADPMSGAPGAIGADVTIGDLGLTLFTGLGVVANDVVVRTRPTLPEQKPARYIIDQVRVKVGLFGLMFNRPTYKIRAHAFDGDLKAAIGMSPSVQTIEIDAQHFVLTGVPGIQQAISLPLQGTIGIKIDAVAPKNLAANLDGKMEIVIEDLIIGDGKAKLTVPGDPFLAQGLTFPRLRLGTIRAQVLMEKGKARLEGFHVQSPDGEAWLDGYVELRDPLGQSTMHGYLRFKPSEALAKREPTVELLNNSMAAAKRSDGFIGFQLSGPLSAIFYLPSPNPPTGVTIKGGGAPTVPSVNVAPPPAIGGGLAPPPPAPTPAAPVPSPPATETVPPPPPPPTTVLPPPPVEAPPPPPGSPTIAPPGGTRHNLVRPERPPDEQPAQPERE
jgi:type II secretion system protein N